MRIAAGIVLVLAGLGPAHAQMSVWFTSVDPQSHADVLEYRKGPVALSVVLYPRDHTADGGMAVTGSWVDCSRSTAYLVDGLGQRETLSGGCAPQAPGVGVFNATQHSTTLGHLLAHATTLSFVLGEVTVPIELTGLREAFAQAAAAQQNAPESTPSSQALPASP